MVELRPRQPLQRLLEHRRIDRRGAVGDASEAGEVVFLEARVGQQRLQHGRHQHDLGDLLARDGLQHLGGLEERHVGVGLALNHPRGDPRQTGGVEQRRDVQAQGVVDRLEVGHAHQRAGPQVAVRQHHALGQAGGAAGVENHREVLAAAPAVLDRRALGDQPLERQHAGRRLAFVGVDQNRFTPGLGDDRLDQRQVHVVDDQHAGVAVVQRVDDLRRAPADVHRIEHRPGPPAGHHVLLEAVGVQRQHGDALAGLHAEVAQRPGQARDALGVLAVGAVAAAIDGRHLVGGHLQRRVQALGQVHGDLGWDSCLRWDEILGLPRRSSMDQRGDSSFCRRMDRTDQTATPVPRRQPVRIRRRLME
ncbi:hypothetical protein D9M70_418960 [compost metagenome]